MTLGSSQRQIFWKDVSVDPTGLGFGFRRLFYKHLAPTGPLADKSHRF
jgi:hypothetical protein